MTTDTPEIIEAMARVIDPEAWEESKWSYSRSGIVAMHAARQESCVKARAAFTVALDHMREPSDAMDLAGDNSFQWGGPTGAEWLEAADSTACWQAMLSELREETLG